MTLPDPFELDHAPSFIDLSKPEHLEYFVNSISRLIASKHEIIAQTFRPETIKLLDRKSPQEINQLLKSALPNYLTEDGLLPNSYYDEFLIQQRNRAHVYCFSACNINSAIVLWSHYADRHTGVAIVFNFSANEYGKTILPVNYSPKNTRATIFSAVEAIEVFERSKDHNIQEKIYQKMLLTKHADWSYEKEMRIVSFSDVVNPSIVIENSLISAIYFGLEISADNRNKLTKLIKEQYLSCKIYASQKNKVKIALEFIEKS